MNELPLNAFVRGRHWQEWNEQLRRRQLVPGAGLRFRESAAGTVVEAAPGNASAPEPIPAPFELYPDSGANKIGIGAGAFIRRSGHQSDIYLVDAQQGDLPAAGRYLLTLLFQGDWSTWHTYVWLPTAGGSHNLALRPGLYPIPIAEMLIADLGNGVRQVTELVPFCRSMPVVEAPDFPFRATFWSAAPTAFSVVSGSGPAPTKLIIAGGIAPYVSRAFWVPENVWTSVAQMTYTLGEEGLETLDGLYFLRLKGAAAGICMASCSLTNLASHGGKAWDDTNGWAQLPICRVDGISITQYVGYSQYAVPLHS